MYIFELSISCQALPEDQGPRYQICAYYQYLLSDPSLQSMLLLSRCVSVPKPGLDQRHIRQVTRYFVNQDQREGTDNKHLIGEPETSEQQY